MPKAPEDPAISEIRRRLFAIELQQKALDDAVKLLPELVGKGVGASQTGAAIAILAVLDTLIRNRVISRDELISSIDGFIAERYGESDVKTEGHVAEGLIGLLRGLRSTER